MEIFRNGNELFEILESMNSELNRIFNLQVALNTIVENGFSGSLDLALSAAAPLINAQNVLLIDSIIGFLEKRDQIIDMSLNR